jgi:EAL domain-containing protein (putative c-di-GMP-specific phosphodiesterase class I)
LYNTEINLALERRRVLEAELEEAILGGQLELHYQPKVVLEAPVRVAGYEALVRWRHPDRGMIPPLEFISLAEDTGLIVELGEWVLTRACRDLMATGLDQTVAVNVSAVQFRKGTVVDAVERALAASGLPAERLEIEITESMLMDNNAVTAEQLKALRARGVKLALDDFGTGYSSLSYLERYPLDTVKIDRSFVAKLGIEARAAAIVRAIVVLAHELGMTPVAEGVETAAQADLLAALGCPMAQGYLFGRPEPAAKLWPSRAAA